jgi:polysaccharide export outer membrane protein
MRIVSVICLFLLLTWPIGAFAEDYVIGDGDNLQISVWGEKQLDAQVIVRPDGKITLPGIGDAPASGYTPKGLSEKLADKLQEFVKKPIVTVTVSGITNNKVYFFGDGAGSGVMSLPGRTTLLQFLCRLGNLKNADLEHAYAVRDGKKLEAHFYDLFAKGDLTKDIMLKPDDIIYIPNNDLNKIYIVGAVNNPKYVFYKEGIRILDAILEAGGFTKFAKENDVLIFRKGSDPGKAITAKVKDLMKDGDFSRNVTLMPGDLIIIKESVF